MKRPPERPKIDLPITKAEIALEILTLPVLLFNFVVIWLYYAHLPETVPSHFDLSGNANGWSHKNILWILSGVGLIVYLMVTLISRFPETFNYLVTITEENARRQYTLAKKFLAIMKLETSVLLFFAIWTIIDVSSGQAAKANSNDLFAMVVLIMITATVYIFASYRLK